MYFIEVSVPIHQSIMYSRVNDSDFVSSFDFSILFCSDSVVFLFFILLLFLIVKFSYRGFGIYSTFKTQHNDHIGFLS
jgi:hypothetical protein